MRNKPRIGISACLLGKPVRHDGGHKRDDWLVDELGKWVTWYPVCPEMEMGLGSPRETVRLLQTSEGELVRMITNKTNKDLTALAAKTVRRITGLLPEIEGFVLKKKSPSCGIERVNLYNTKGHPEKKGVGFFAERLMKSHPGLPVIEEGRLTDPEQREQFVMRIFALFRWRQVPAKISAIQKFHQNYKLLLMAHSPMLYQKLGGIAANSAKGRPSEIREEYESFFLEALRQPSSTRKRVNVLQHMFGYFRGKISEKEKRSLLKAIEEYGQGELSFLASLKLIEHVASSLSIPYLEAQLLFDPYPKELALRKYL